MTARAGRRRSLDDLWAYFQTNVMGTLNFLEVCRKYGVKKFCCPPPPTYMGFASPGPFERTPIANTERPLSPYGASKKAAEIMCYDHQRMYRCCATSQSTARRVVKARSGLSRGLRRRNRSFVTVMVRRNATSPTLATSPGERRWRSVPLAMKLSTLATSTHLSSKV